ncbi:MAG: sugar phosphate isomerase/epimerase [Chloroflexi bacterium]|nr:sugar phosphate isomerase/epimerase [Chloroflexota bacterium]
MSILVFRALWGMTGPLPEQMERIAAAGYDGIEAWPGAVTTIQAEFIRLVEAHQLKLIMAWNADRREDLAPVLNELASYHPIKINLHSGHDYFTHDEGCAFIEEALRLEDQIGIPVSHETHRGRIFYTPWDTLFYLQRFDTLKLTADYSHWVNVCERLPDDQAEALALANQRTIHVHGRVGYEEGPQVPDPSAPEYAYHLAWHEQQWEQIKQHRAAANDLPLTFTPEYGPPNYLHTLPHTNVPVADLWNVCLWGMNRARQVLG